jgi:hypothetical protein
MDETGTMLSMLNSVKVLVDKDEMKTHDYDHGYQVRIG